MENKTFGLLCIGAIMSIISLTVLFSWWLWSSFDGVNYDWQLTETIFLILLVGGIFLIILGLNTEFNAWFGVDQEKKQRQAFCPYCGKELIYSTQKNRYYCSYCNKAFRLRDNTK